jgi:hypothetical protein
MILRPRRLADALAADARDLPMLAATTTRSWLRSLDSGRRASIFLRTPSHRTLQDPRVALWPRPTDPRTPLE